MCEKGGGESFIKTCFDNLISKSMELTSFFPDKCPEGQMLECNKKGKKCKCVGKPEECEEGTKLFCKKKNECTCLEVKSCGDMEQLICKKDPPKKPKDCTCFPTQCTPPEVLKCHPKKEGVCMCETPAPSSVPSMSPSPVSS